jgi:hypothetical protein
MGFKVIQKDQLKDAMQKLFKHQGPGLIEISADVKLI